MSAVVHLGSLELSPAPSCCDRYPLECWRCAIKHEHRSYAIKQEPADAPEETHQVTIADEVAFIISHRIKELEDPNRRICMEEQSQVHHRARCGAPVTHTDEPQLPPLHPNMVHVPPQRTFF